MPEPGYVCTLSSNAAAGSSNHSVFVSARVGARTLTDVRFSLTTVPEPAGPPRYAAGFVP